MNPEIPKDYNYSNDTIKDRVFTNMLNNISFNEVLDQQVEALLKEQTEYLVDKVLDMSCQISKHKGDDTLTTDSIYYSFYKLANIVEPNSVNTSLYQTLRNNEVNKSSTQDHKKRVELTKEENKATNE